MSQQWKCFCRLIDSVFPFTLHLTFYCAEKKCRTCKCEQGTVFFHITLWCMNKSQVSEHPLNTSHWRERRIVRAGMLTEKGLREEGLRRPQGRGQVLLQTVTGRKLCVRAVLCWWINMVYSDTCCNKHSKPNVRTDHSVCWPLRLVSLAHSNHIQIQYTTMLVRAQWSLQHDVLYL